MDWKWNRRQVLRAGAVTLAVSAMARSATRSALAQDIPTSPETGAIKMAIEPWLGYGQWQIAAREDNLVARSMRSAPTICLLSQVQRSGSH